MYVLIHICNLESSIQIIVKNCEGGQRGEVTEGWKRILRQEQDAPQVSLGDRNVVKPGQASPNSVPSEIGRIQLNLMQQFREIIVWRLPCLECGILDPAKVIFGEFA